MRLYSQLLQRRNLPLVARSLLLAGTLVLGGLLVWGFAWWSLESRRQAQQESQTSIEVLRGELAALQAAQDELDRNLDRFRALRDAGFVGDGDRIAWTEALQRVQRRLALPEMAFELSPAIALDAPPPELVGQLPEGAAIPLQGALAHDLHLRLSGVHEGEVLALVQGVAAERVGVLRLQRCLWERSATIAGLDVDCQLRWISYLPAATTTAEVAP